MKPATIFLGILFCCGCNNLAPTKQYKIISSTDGKVYRLNARTGEVALVTPEGIRIIPQLIGKKFKSGRFEVQEIKK